MNVRRNSTLPVFGHSNKFLSFLIRTSEDVVSHRIIIQALAVSMSTS